MMTHGNFASLVASILINPELGGDKNDIHLSYLPLPHLYERLL